MPAGCGKRCWTCYWKQLAQRRIQIDGAALSSPKLARRFESYGAWLLAKNGGHKTAQRIHRHLQFFIEIDRAWDDIPDYETLLQHFGAKRLRRNLLPMRWIEEEGLIVSDSAAREADSERRRIEGVLDRLAVGSTARTLLDGYHDALRLRMKAGKLTLRSLRLALSPAAGLLETATEREAMPPNQRILERFLRESPGQRAAVNGFVTYLRQTRRADLTMPKRRTLQQARERRARLLPELLDVMRETSGTDRQRVDRRWLRLALQYFHHLPAKAGKNAAEDDVTTDTEGITVQVKNRSYWIPWPKRAAAASTASMDMQVANQLHRGTARGDSI